MNVRIRTFAAILCIAILPQIAVAADYTVQDNVISTDQARFTFLSPTLLRIEYAPSGRFVDRPTVLVLNRDWPDVQVDVRTEDEWLVAETKALELRWLVGRLPFNNKNLMVGWRAGGKAGAWRPGTEDQANLGGTNHSLDGVSRDNLRPIGPGMLSREGWTLLDDSERPIWLGEDNWLKERPDYDAIDWYFFAYGNDYDHMLAEYVKLCGRIPMLPRYAWGTWYSRYWAYTDQELKDIVNKFRDLDIPLDVLVIDVDWHKYGWEGYDWNPEYFPQPEKFLDWVHDQGIHVTMNNHPGSPLPVEDSHYEAAADMADLPKEKRGDPLAWDLADNKMNRAFVEAVHWPLERIGVDFWWIDGNPPARMRGLNSTVWTAKTYYDGTQRRTGNRSLIFSRYGDLAQHRYPVGFSGDTLSHWAVLNYEIRHTLRAGNVAFPYWSHDIGGFHGKKLDPELYVRWCQFGVFSPIVRLHSNHGIRVPWEYGDQAIEIVRRYFKLRYRMYPYLNACQRRVYETAMPLCRAMYMHWPRHPEAYQYDYQYMFGPGLLIAPIAIPGDDGTAQKQVWLPPGLWWDYWTGKPYEGPRTILYTAPIDRCPVFAKAGAIVPTQPEMDYLGRKKPDPITLNIWPGAGGEFTMYDDDGMSLNYKDDAFRKTEIEYAHNDKSAAIRIGPTIGDYDGAPESRDYVVNLHCVPEPDVVTMTSDDDRPLPAKSADDPSAKSACWSYSDDRSQATIRIPSVSADECVRLSVTLPWSLDHRKLTAQLQAIAECANQAIAAATAHDLDRQTVKRIDEVADAAELDRPEKLGTAALRRHKKEATAAMLRAWHYLATNVDDAATRRNVMTQLAGLSSSAHVSQKPDSDQQTVTVRAATRVPIDGATMRARPALPDGWTIVGKPTIRTAGFPTEGFGSMTFSAQLTGDTGVPPVGKIALGADVTIAMAGASIDLHPQAGIDCSFVQQWHLIGPFSNAEHKGLETVYPPEKGIDLTASYEGVGGKAQWQTTEWSLPDPTSPPVFIDLRPRFEPDQQVVAYAVAYINSDAEKQATLSIGTDDGCKVWLNGESVLSHPELRAPAPGQDNIDVTLQKGLNTVVYKVANWHDQWGLYLQIVGRHGQPLDGLTNPLHPQ